MHEQSKAAKRRWREGEFLARYFVGHGIDVGAGPDGLGRYTSLFPGLRGVRGWDLADGDAQYLKSAPDAAYDFLHSSHCLEHLVDPQVALTHWLRVVKPGGYLVVTVPDEDLYERGVFPSRFNSDHKWSFTLHKLAASSWSAKSLNVLDLLRAVSNVAEIEQVRQIREFFDAGLPPDVDQTQSPAAECAIEFVLRKRAVALPTVATPGRAALISRALRLYEAKEYDSVLDLLEQHSGVAGQSADILNAAGASAFALKSPERALMLYRRATVQMPGHYDAWNNLGIALYEGGQLEAAEAAHRQAISLKPDESGFKRDLVKLLIRTLRLDEAQTICDAELAQQPEALSFLGDLGAIYMRTGRAEEARALFERVIAIQPDSESIALNVGVRLTQAGYYAEAEQLYRGAIARYAGSDMARFHLSLLLLLTGRYAEGWALYEARSAVRKTPLPEYQFALWKGEPLVGKRILLSYEQGFGDEIMIGRYVATLKAAGAARVGMICRRQMVPLLKTLEGVELLTPDTGDVIHLRDDEFDFWSLPFEIPRYLNTVEATIPANVPYLKALPERRSQWAARLPKTGFKVGLVWKGSTLHSMDVERSLASLKQLAPLWQVPGVAFISLQKGQAEDEAITPPEGQTLLDLGTDINDFGDSAAIVDQLDLVIAVDTAIVHVAGALNKPCWVILPHFATDWRWLLEREDSPWYPSIKLFRQERTGDWAPTIERIAAELATLVAQAGQAAPPIKAPSPATSRKKK